MPVMTDYTAGLAAAATTANLFAGNINEFLARPSMVRVAINASAVGMTGRVLIGNRTVLNNEPVSLANRFPQIPEDIILEEPGMPGERISVFLTNGSGGALNAWTKVDIQEL